MLVKVVIYRDFWLRLAISILLALFFVFLGTESVTDVVKGKHFFTDLIAGFSVIFIISSYINLLTAYLDTQYPWNKYLVTRLLYQLIASVVIPSVFALAYMYIYLIIILGLKKEEVLFFKTEFPIGVLFIIFWNVVYVGYYFSRENKKQKEGPLSLKTKLFTLQNIRTGTDILPALPEHPGMAGNPDREAEITVPANIPGHSMKVFIAVSGNKSIPIAAEDIAWFNKTGNYTSLKTFRHESFLLNHSLDELVKLLDVAFFFRANQQFIITAKACHYFTSEEGGKLAVYLTPENEEPVIISPERVPAFKEWITR